MRSCRLRKGKGKERIRALVKQGFKCVYEVVCRIMGNRVEISVMVYGSKLNEEGKGQSPLSPSTALGPRPVRREQAQLPEPQLWPCFCFRMGCVSCTLSLESTPPPSCCCSGIRVTAVRKAPRAVVVVSLPRLSRSGTEEWIPLLLLSLTLALTNSSLRQCVSDPGVIAFDGKRWFHKNGRIEQRWGPD